MKNMQKTGSRRKAGIRALISAVIVGIVCLCSFSARAQFTWPVYESFGEYIEGEQLGTNDMLLNWNVGNGGTNGVSSYIVTATAAMSFPALVGDPNPDPKGVESVYINNTSADRGFMFATNNLTTGAMYASFLLNYIDNGVGTTGYSQNRAMFNLVTGATDETNGSFGSIDSSVWLTPDYRIVINKNYLQGGAFSGSSPVIATNVPHLIVVRYKVNTGGNDEMDLWIDPMPFGNNGSIPPPTLTTTNGSNITNFNACILNNRATPQYTATAFYVDEIRLGDTWSSVTPLTTAAPGPLYTVTGGGSTCPGNSLGVVLSGSATTNVYFLYTNNVVSVALPGTGSALNFGLQSVPAVYTVLASNINTAAIGWMSNSVTITAIPPPILLTEPLPVISATNYRAEFKTTLSGSGFAEQWYLNNVPVTNSTNISGATTNDLVITFANATNVGNYYCSISNSCGEVSYTTTNSLTLDSPNNLVWAGDSFSINTWITGPFVLPGPFPVQEFTSGGNASYYNQGDNVTFNDSYIGAQYGSTITLSNTLTPSSITYNTSQNLSFAGPGTISGTGSLLVNDSGTLTFSSSTANTFNGGTVISNGDVNIPNSWGSIGTGPLTLAGGTFESNQKSGSGTGSGLGFQTNIFVTANSTWQVDKTGTQCAGSGFGLFGNAGITLTITNSATTPIGANVIKFGGVFTNSLNFVLLENSVAVGSSMQMGAYNTSGNQVYNGVISGPTCVFLVGAAGNVYLNGANTYPSNTVVTAGLLAGSGSITGPLLASGGTIGGGSQSGIGTFTVGGYLSITNTKVLIRVDKSLVQSNDLISVTGICTNTGTATLTITNIGTIPLAVGDTFQVFNKAISNGAGFTVSGPTGVTWNNNLASNGSVSVATLPAPALTNAPTITSIALQGNNVAIGGTNGNLGANVYLLMGTNITEPLSQWQSVATGSIGGNSFSFTATNAVTAGSAGQYYILSSTNN